MTSLNQNKTVSTIVVVDDNKLVLQMVSEMLKECGINVVPVKCAEDALETIAKLDTLPNLVISDITMPGMTGLDMYGITKELYPELPVLFMTGASEAYYECADLMGDGRLLQKPFRRAELLERISRMLGIE